MIEADETLGGRASNALLTNIETSFESKWRNPERKGQELFLMLLTSRTEELDPQRLIFQTSIEKSM